MPFIMNDKGKEFLNIAANIKRFTSQLTNIAQESAALATETSQEAFIERLSGRPFAPARQGRPTTNGQFPTFILWKPAINDGNISVSLDISTLKAKAPYWIIQEIGTGRSATIYGPGGGNFTVKSQIGRAISRNLVWANSELEASGHRSSSGNRNQQLFLIPTGSFSPGSKRLTIGKEIQGKHFIQTGGEAGFNHLRTTVQSAFLKAFN